MEEQLKTKLHIEIDEDLGYAICSKNHEFDGDIYYPRLVELNENMKIKMILLPQFNYKWLYTLWIAGTEIIDDLEECDE